MSLSYLIALGCLTFVLFLGMLWWRQRRVASLVRAELEREKTRCEVAQLPASGQARVEGQVVAQETLTTPCRRLEAVGYALAIRSVGPGPRDRESPDVVVVSHVNPFWLEDDSGRVFVEPRTTDGLSGPASSFEPYHRLPSPELWEVLEREGVDVAGVLAAPDLSVAEDVLTAGARVRVDGAAVYEVDTSGESVSFRSPPRRRVLRDAIVQILVD